MRIIVDHDVPRGALPILTERGHDVVLVEDILFRTASDAEIARLVDIEASVVMTCNKRHFKRLLPSVPTGARRRFTKASVIFLTCRQSQVVHRLPHFIDEIEAEYAKLRTSGSGRMVVEIGDSYFRIDR